MTKLEKMIRRQSSAVRHEKSQTRALILSLEPPATIGVRLAGTSQTYRLHANAVYELAVQAHEREIARRAAALVKAEKLTKRAAAKRARKELKVTLAIKGER